MVRNYSDAIRISRFLCILFMSYVHLHFFTMPGAAFPAVQEVVVDTLGRSSVPLLSVVSGYLMVSYFTKRAYATAVRNRFRSLIVPMVLWNAIAVLIWGWSDINDLLALTGNSKLIYLTFLRDVFVMSLLTPFLLRAAKVAPVPLFVVAAAVYLTDLNTIVVLRPQIVFFYVLGVLFSVHPVRLPKEACIASVGFLVVICAGSAIWTDLNDSHLFDAIIKRPVTALAFWSIALAAANRSSSLAALDRYVFPFFLAHGILFWAVGAAYYRVELLHTPAAYLAIWLITPILTFAGVALVLMIWDQAWVALKAKTEMALSR